MFHDLGKQIIGNDIKRQSSQMYAHRSIQRINREGEEIEVQKRKLRTGMIKVLGLRHKREKKIDPRLSWLMFHNIYHIYSAINNKEERNAAVLLTSMSKHEKNNNANK